MKVAINRYLEINHEVRSSGTTCVRLKLDENLGDRYPLGRI